MMSVGQEGEKDSPSTTANSIAAAGGGRAKAQCPGLGGCRLKALPALSEKFFFFFSDRLSEKLNKKSTEEEDLSVFHLL